HAAEPTPVAGTAVRTATQAGPQDVRPGEIPLTSGATTHPRRREIPETAFHCQSRCPPVWAGRNIGGVNFDSTDFRGICEKNFSDKLANSSAISANLGGLNHASCQTRLRPLPSFCCI